MKCSLPQRPDMHLCFTHMWTLWGVVLMSVCVYVRVGLTRFPESILWVLLFAAHSSRQYLTRSFWYSGDFCSFLAPSPGVPGLSLSLLNLSLPPLLGKVGLVQIQEVEIISPSLLYPLRLELLEPCGDHLLIYTVVWFWEVLRRGISISLCPQSAPSFPVELSVDIRLLPIQRTHTLVSLSGHIGKQAVLWWPLSGGWWWLCVWCGIT